MNVSAHNVPTLPRTSHITHGGPQPVYKKTGNLRWKLILPVILARKMRQKSYLFFFYGGSEGYQWLHYITKSACWVRYVLLLLLTAEEILNKLSWRWSSLLNYISPSASDSPLSQDTLSQNWIYLNPSDQINTRSLVWLRRIQICWPVVYGEQVV